MASSFAHQLGTNYCPTDDELSQIHALLVEPSLRLRRLDDEIADLQKAIDKLTEERGTLGAFVDAHKALLSPIRRLPLDLIQGIFVACLPTHRNCVMSATEVPVLLGRICSSWRAISLVTPRLWARLHIVGLHHRGAPDPSVDAKVAQRIEVLRTWLSRSGGLPLSISIHGFTQDLLRTLLPFAPRWQHIRFLSRLTSMGPFSRIAEADVPMLETIAFTHDLPREKDWDLERFTFLRGPRIWGFTASTEDFATVNLPLRWHQLTTLQIEGFPGGEAMTSQKALQMLSRCPHLRVCKLVFNDSNDTPHSPVELKFLHSLHLALWIMDAAVTFLLDRLLLPELRNFTLRTLDAYHARADEHDPPPLFHYLELWNKLESLEIETNSFSMTSWPQAIRSLPSTMRQLVIHDTEAGPPIEIALTILASPPEIPAQCPALEELRIFRSRSLLEPALQQFIAARMRGPSPPTLRRVKVAFNREMEADILPDLQAFIDAGLRVSLTYDPHFQIQASPWEGLEPAED
ncbi:hypothetical protein B0H16DRAFT_1687359 [Mycena metata]|uniref:F-box domain-containing protein n=1 Tax=Mycena metata TaxID=1033252 RepID=A0AAD7JIU8_9AGAR|nr:hypothetical protein B0H16DRAFT_1687359 [Mycena metata]